MKKFIFLALLMLVSCAKIQPQISDTTIQEENNSELKQFFDGMDQLRRHCKDVVAENPENNNSLNFQRCDCAIDVLTNSMLEANEAIKKQNLTIKNSKMKLLKKSDSNAVKVPNIFF